MTQPLTAQEQVHFEHLLRNYPGMTPRNARKDARRLAKGKPAMVDIRSRNKATLLAKNRLLYKHVYQEGYIAHRRGYLWVHNPYMCDYSIALFEAFWDAGWHDSEMGYPLCFEKNYQRLLKRR